MKKQLKLNTQAIIKFLAFVGLFTLSNFAMAAVDGLDSTKSAFEWIVDALIYVTTLAFSTVVIIRLWQIYLGQREWSEVITPALIVSLVIGAKVFGPLIIAKLGASV